jgi:hypothetical protein
MKKSILALLLIFSNVSMACFGEWGHPKSLVPNGQASNLVNADMTEVKFLAIIAKLENIYGPEIIARFSSLKVNKLWTNNTANASAMRKGPTYEVNMYGGLARNVNMTPDGFAMVLCHELGHHLAGQPRVVPSAIFKSLFGIKDLWASNEGQSDYFASTKCMREYLKDEDNISFLKGMDVPALVEKDCAKNYKNHTEQAICQRISMAGLSLAKTLHSLRNPNGGSTFPSFDKPDQKKIRATFHSHPAAQCRLDTYYQGALCNVSKDIAFSIDNTKQGSCINRKQGERPRCWFKN